MRPFSHAGVLVFVDLGALVPTFLDLAFPVRVLVAHGARGSGSRPQPRPAMLWEFHCVWLRGQNNRVTHNFMSSVSTSLTGLKR